MSEVQRNAASIVAQAGQAREEASDSQGIAPSWDMSSVIESPSASHSETEIPTTFDINEHAPVTAAEIEAAIEKSLIPQLPAIPTPNRPATPSEIQSDLENSLKSQFSSDRFEQAMDTLDQYGPEEGLRRLRENDPEVAKRIEQHRNRSRSEDSDKSEEEISR